MIRDCNHCPVHAAAVRMHREAKRIAGRAVSRSKYPADSTLARDELRAAVLEFERVALEVLELRFGCQEADAMNQPEVRHG
jgi:hypothetical protein